MRSSNFLRQAKRRHTKVISEEANIFSADDQIVGKDTLASILDVSITSVERWIRDGMPVAQRGDKLQEWVFDMNQVKQWKKHNS
ncbi:MAG: terminase small subunit [Enterobacterales bacterium]|nr:terminase small subunit [Enterobacterales bacterium]